MTDNININSQNSIYYCIYRITNNLNGKTYIGQHHYSDPEKPLHITETKVYPGSGKLLWLAYKKYGIENFSSEVLIKDILTKKEINFLEKKYIKEERERLGRENVYNISDGGGGAILWGSDNPAFGKPSANKGRKMSELQKEKIRNSNLGHVVSKETRQKISEKTKGRKAYNRGVSMSLGQREYLSKVRKSKNLHWYNNGVIQIQASSCPEGFVKGRFLSEKQKKYTYGSKKNRSIALKGTHWYNNGTIQIQTKNCPEGFIQGRLRKN